MGSYMGMLDHRCGLIFRVEIQFPVAHGLSKTLDIRDDRGENKLSKCSFEMT